MSQIQSDNLKEISAAEFDQVLFIKYYMEEGKAWKAYKRLHPECTDASAAVGGSRMLNNVKMSDLMEEVGLSKKNIALLVAQNAAKPTKKVLKKTTTRTELPAGPPELDKNGEMYFFRNKKGNLIAPGTQEVTEFEYMDVIDHAARNAALNLASKLNKTLEEKDGDGKLISIGAVNVINYADPAASPAVTEGEIIPESTVGQVALETSATPVQEEQPTPQSNGITLTKF